MTVHARARERLPRRGAAGSCAAASSSTARACSATRCAGSAPVRLLFVLDGFEGWEPHDDWRDLSFYVSHGDAIERIAIVGDERWRSESLMFASADLRKAPVEFFSPERLAGARDWLSA